MPARHPRRRAAAGAALLALAGCTVGPDYVRPDAPVPAAYKEAPPAGWKPGTPQDDTARGAWWSVFGDPTLDALERQVEVSNQNLREAEAAYREAVAVAAQARAGYFPTLSASASAQHSGQGGGGNGNAAASAAIANGAVGGLRRSSGSFTQYDVTASASWAPDVWGRIRRTVESDVANAQASAADLASARLSAQAALATAYMQLRSDDELQRLLDAAVEAFRQALAITQNRYNQGVAARSDVASAQTQLDTTRSQAVGVGVQRSQLEHAIAVLVGKPPADFSLPPAPLALAMPEVPTGLPSTLLERRPDIAAAERTMAAANAQIGLAISAYYPDLTLTASYGFVGTALGNLLQASNSLWSVGGQLAETLFDGGLRGAQVEAARAVYDQRVATYRQSVLTAFQQVEDELAALRILAEQAEVQDAAVRAAQEAERLFLNQYRAGTVAYTSVITAQTAALTNEEQALTILQNRLVASVALVQALGGGWSTAELPQDVDVREGAPAQAAAAAASR